MKLDGLEGVKNICSRLTLVNKIFGALRSANVARQVWCSGLILSNCIRGTKTKPRHIPPAASAAQCICLSCSTALYFDDLLISSFIVYDLCACSQMAAGICTLQAIPWLLYVANWVWCKRANSVVIQICKNILPNLKKGGENGVNIIQELFW